MLFFRSTTDSHCKISSESPVNSGQRYYQTMQDENAFDAALLAALLAALERTVVMYRE